MLSEKTVMAGATNPPGLLVKLCRARVGVILAAAPAAGHTEAAVMAEILGVAVTHMGAPP